MPDVVERCELCRNFPKTPKVVVSRESLSEEIDRWFNDYVVIVVTGDPMTGKSLLAADYYRRTRSALGIFLATHGHGISLEQFVRTSVVEQANWLVDGVAGECGAASEADYQRALLKLQKFAKRESLTWIVDGDTVASADPDRSELLGLLPISYREFNFLITSETELPDGSLPRACRVKRIPMPVISVEEARVLLADLNMTEAQVQEIRRICQSSVGRIQWVRSLVESGADLEEVLEGKNPSLQELFELEWNQIPGSQRQRVERAIAAAVFAPSGNSLARLASNCGESCEEMLELVRAVRFLHVEETADNDSVIEIRPTAAMPYLKRKLASYEGAVRGRVIDELLRAASNERTTFLPTELQKAGRHREVLEELGTSHFLNLLEAERTLRALRSRALLGHESAKIAGDEAKGLAFALLSSLVCGLTFSVGSAAKLCALVRLGQVDPAMALAKSAPTSEERLQLLSVTGRAIRSEHLAMPPDLVESIRVQTQEIDTTLLGDAAIETACNLLHVEPEAALHVMNSYLAASRNTEGASNQGVQLTQVELKSATEAERFGSLEAIDAYRARAFWTEAVSICLGWPVETLMARCKGRPASFVVFMYSSWLSANRRDPACVDVAKVALQELFADLHNAVKLSDLLAIAIVLPHITDRKERDELCGRVETHYALLARHGTSTEAIRLRLLIYAARHAADPEGVELSLLEIKYEIEDTPELSTRVECWAWYLDALSRFEGSANLEESSGLLSDAADRLDESIGELLENAADHYAVAKRAIRPIVNHEPSRALQLAARLNTIAARDNAYRAIARVLVQMPEVSFPDLVSSIMSIQQLDVRESSIAEAYVSLSRRNPVWLRSVSRELRELWTNARSPATRTQCAAVLQCFHKKVGDEERAEELKRELETSWSSIPSYSLQVELGFWVAAELAVHDRELAGVWLSKANELVSSAPPVSDSLIAALYRTTSIASRAFGYANGSCDVEGDSFRRLVAAIDALPCSRTQVWLWSSLGVRLYFNGCSKLSGRIAREYVEPLIEEAAEDPMLMDELVHAAYPLLFAVSQVSADQRLRHTGCEVAQNRSRLDATAMLLRRLPCDDPFAVEGACYRGVTSTDLDGVVHQIRLITIDSYLHEAVERLCEVLVAMPPKEMRAAKKVDYVVDVKAAVCDRLPDAKNVKHEGYLICCLAMLESTIAKVKPGSSRYAASAFWENLHARAMKIANIADRPVVLATIGVHAVVKAESPVQQWASGVHSDLQKIPTAEDKVGRYEWIAKLVQGKDKALAKELISEAATLSFSAPSDPDLDRRQRRILDFANALDHDLSSKLIGAIDKDEARVEYLRRRDEANNARRELAARADSDCVARVDDYQLGRLCEGNLAALNAGRIGVRPVEEFSTLYARGKSMSMDRAYWLWCWVVENCLRKNSRGRRGTEDNREVLEGTLLVSEIALGLVRQLARSPLEQSADSGVVGAGERERFLEKLCEWAASNNGRCIRISDPYFGPQELEVVKRLSEAAPHATFRILTSRRWQKEGEIGVDELYSSAWSELLDTPPPQIEVTVIGFLSSGSHPVHDRWIVAEDSGLTLGSSINSIGYGRISDVSPMTALSAQEKCRLVDTLIDMRTRNYNGERLTRLTFSV